MSVFVPIVFATPAKITLIPSFDNRAKFQQSFSVLRSQGGGGLLLEAGRYDINFPDLANDVDPETPQGKSETESHKLQIEKLLCVPPRTLIIGKTDSRGNLLTEIHWKLTSAPLFLFLASDSSGIRNVRFVFDGVQPQFFPWSQEQVLNSASLHIGQVGGPFELSAAVYTLGSSNLTFENLVFTSSASPKDNLHTFGFGIVSKGAHSKSLVNLDSCTSGNVFRSITFSDFVMGIVASGQCSPVFENISGDYRGSWFRSFAPHRETNASIKNIGPPGHLIYLTNQYFNAGSVSSGASPNVLEIKNSKVTLRDIREGDHVLSNFNSLGTLALKNIEGGSIENIQSRHPAGLIVSMVDCHHLQLRHLSWSSQVDLCQGSSSRVSCQFHAIALEPGDINAPISPNSFIEFDDVKLSSTLWSASFGISSIPSESTLSNNIAVHGLEIRSSADLQVGQIWQEGMITVRGKYIKIDSATYVPLSSPLNSPHQSNYAVLVQSGSSAVSIELQVDRNITLTDVSSDIYKCIDQGMALRGLDVSVKCHLSSK